LAAALEAALAAEAAALAALAAPLAAAFFIDLALRIEADLALDLLPAFLARLDIVAIIYNRNKKI
jgi:hypothetical protein